MQDVKPAAVPMNDREREVAKEAKKGVFTWIIAVIALAIVAKFVFG